MLDAKQIGERLASLGERARQREDVLLLDLVGFLREMILEPYEAPVEEPPQPEPQPPQPEE